jgi:hypothetical protein
MTTTSANAIELNAYIAAENAAFEAKCIAEGATFWCASALTAKDLAEYGVYTVDQYRLWQAEVEMQEAAKDQRWS